MVKTQKTKIAVFLMTILCAVALGLGVSNSVKASSYIPKKQLYVFHLKKGHKYYQTYQWDRGVTKIGTDRYGFFEEFYIDNKFGGSHVVAPKTAKYDIRVEGVKYRPVVWRHNYTGNTSFVKKSQFKRSFKKGGYFNNGKAVGLDAALVIINAKGIPNGENQVTLNLVKLMNDKPVQNDQYFEKAQAKIKEFNEDPDWSDYIMDYEDKRLEREQYAREEGKEEGLKRGIKILVSSLKRAGNTKQEIMHLLEQNYGSDFTDEQLENFLKES